MLALWPSYFYTFILINCFTCVGCNFTRVQLFQNLIYISGNTDIHNGNLKLILGLTWSLIAHYQLGASNFPPKKLMLAWLKAVLPDCKIKNFTTDWNNGIYLSALLDHCSPGLMPNWKHMNPDSG